MIKRTIAVLLATAGLLTAQETLQTQPPQQQKAEETDATGKPAFHPDLPAGTQVKKDIEYVQNGGPKRSLDLYLPANATAASKLPVVIWIHGGAWRSGDKTRWCPAYSLLSRGYAVATINYRLSKTDDAPWPEQLFDCKAVVRWVRAHAAEYGFDPNHVGVWGHSAGGHLVTMLGVTGKVPEMEGNEGNPNFSSAVQAVCDWSGPTNLIADYEKDPKNPKSAFVQLLGGKNPDVATEEKAKQCTPFTYISPATAANIPPFFIAHGQKDPIVPPPDSDKLVAALKAVGVPVTFVPVPEGQHGIGGPDLEKQAGDFFDKYLKPTH